MKTTLGILLIVALTLTLVGTANAQVKMDGFKFGTAIENSDITGESITFPASGASVYCWIRVLDGIDQTLTMKWFLNGEAKDEIPVKIAFSPMRTYSYKEIHDAGTWKVDVANDSGRVLQSGEFTAQ